MKLRKMIVLLTVTVLLSGCGQKAEADPQPTTAAMEEETSADPQPTTTAMEQETTQIVETMNTDETTEAADAAEKEESMSTGNLAITGTFVDGGMLSAADRAAMIVLEDDQYSMVAKLQATAAIHDLRIYTLDMDFSEAEGIRFRGTQRGQVPALQAGQAIYLKLSFPGDSPHHGISYVDAAGTTHYLSLMQSGFDGSLALGEEAAFK